jgi:hypothetical protein
MGTVYLRLTDGRCLVLQRQVPTAEAASLKAHVEHWLATHMVIDLTTARGTVEEIPPAYVRAVEMEPDVDEASFQ